MFAGCSCTCSLKHSLGLRYQEGPCLSYRCSSACLHRVPLCGAVGLCWQLGGHSLSWSASVGVVWVSFPLGLSLVHSVSAECDELLLFRWSDGESTEVAVYDFCGCALSAGGFSLSCFFPPTIQREKVLSLEKEQVL